LVVIPEGDLLFLLPLLLFVLVVVSLVVIPEGDLLFPLLLFVLVVARFGRCLSLLSS
jgi:hypothetical protein